MLACRILPGASSHTFDSRRDERSGRTPTDAGRRQPLVRVSVSTAAKRQRRKVVCDVSSRTHPPASTYSSAHQRLVFPGHCQFACPRARDACTRVAAVGRRPPPTLLCARRGGEESALPRRLGAGQSSNGGEGRTGQARRAAAKSAPEEVFFTDGQPQGGAA